MLAYSKKKEPTAPEVWRDIPGYNGAYQASTQGQIRKIWPKSGKATLLQPYTHAGRHKSNACRNQLRVHITEPDGRRVERTVLQLVAQTFLRVPPGMRAIHKNGVRSDNALNNIALMSCKELGAKYGGNSHRRPVVKIDAQGEIIACYPSARAAARENYISNMTVKFRCDGKVKNEYALDGFTYRWDD